MGRKLSVEPSFYEENFLEEAKLQKKKSQYQKYLSLHYIQQGKSQLVTASLLGVSPSAVYKWLKNYRSSGRNGLLCNKIPGRPRKLAKEKLEEFRDSFLKKQESLSGGRLFGIDAQNILKEEYNCDYKISTVYHLLKESGLSWITGRSQNPESSKEKQEEFKKFSKESTGIFT